MSHFVYWLSIVAIPLLVGLLVGIVAGFFIGRLSHPDHWEHPSGWNE